jgi:cytochrome P450
MGHSVAEVLKVDLFDREVLLNPYPLYDRLRAHRGALVAGDGCRILSRHAEVRAALQNHRSFSSEETNGATRRTLPVLVGTDPPEHTRLRRLSAGYFSAQARASWERAAEERIQALVDEVVRPGRLEAVSPLCSAVPIVVLAHVLGVDEADLFWLLADDPARYRSGRRQLFARFFRDQLARRRQDERPGLLRSIGTPSRNGDVLSEEEIIAFCILLLAAGVDSIRDLLANLLVELATRPSLWDEITSSPDLDGLSQEWVRFVSPVQGVFRTAAKPMELASVPVRPGDRVLLLIGSANRDEEVWPDAASLRLDRYVAPPHPEPHLGWGAGVHACLGGLLARVETRAVLQSLVEKRVRLSLHEPPLRGRNPYFRTVKRLALTVSI